MAVVRFLSPNDPSLSLRSVPAQFVDGVFDMNDADAEAIGRMRYLGTPFGVIEIGVRTQINPWLTEFEVAQSIGDPNSTIGQALRAYFTPKSA